MAITNSDRVQKALETLRDGIQPGCAAAWLAKYGVDWIDVVNAKDVHGAGKGDDTDLAWLLKGMSNTWQEVWRSRMSVAERGFVNEICTK